MSFRLIDSGACGAAFNMALDEALALSINQHLAPPAIRFYGWDRPSLSLGRFQKKNILEKKDGGLGLDFIKESGLPVVVRPTGGRAVLHGNELTYSVSSRYEGVFRGKDLFGCYAVISSAIERALRRFGVPVQVKNGRGAIGRQAGRTALCFGSVSYAEITSGGKKIVGSAQRRWPEGFLQQGSIPFEIDEFLGRKVFRGSFDPGAMAGLKSLAPDASPGVLKQFLKEEFEGVLGAPLVPAEPAPEELARARQLLPRYFSSSSF